MADLTQIELPNGGTYDLKDAKAVPKRDSSGAVYTALAGNYSGGVFDNGYWRIRIQGAVSGVYNMVNMEISLRPHYSQSDNTYGKILIYAYHGNSTPLTWNNFVAFYYGNVNGIEVFGSDNEYFYIKGCKVYTTISVDKVLIGDSGVGYDQSNVTIDAVSALPTTYQTATMYRDYNTNYKPTKSDVGLGNVENKSSATIRGELTSSNVTTALGYTPPTTNTTYTFANGDDSFTVTPSGSSAQTVKVNAYKLRLSDTRSDNQLPSWYMTNYGRSIIEEFKSCSSIGVGSVITGTYCTLTTFTPWNDSSGGRPVQIALSDSGVIAKRVATADATWGSWTALPNTDTKNTAGSTDTSSKIFLIGATSQAANPQTYSDNEVYATNGVLTTKSVQVGGGSCTLQYNSTTKSCDFVFT